MSKSQLPSPCLHSCTPLFRPLGLEGFSTTHSAAQSVAGFPPPGTQGETGAVAAHWPVPGSQAATWAHGVSAPHTSGTPKHTPAVHVSGLVRALPSPRAVPAVFSVIVLSSCSAATAPVPTVTVTPGATSRNAPSPVATEFRSAPVSSNTSSPTSSGAGARFVQMTTVSTLLSLIAPGMSAASWAACPSLKVGSGVSCTPARPDAPPAATTTSNATSARRALITCRPAAPLRDLDQRDSREGGGRAGRAGRRGGDRVHLVRQQCGAEDILRRADHPARAVAQRGRTGAGGVEGQGLVLVEDHRGGRADRHRLARADVEKSPPAPLERGAQRPRLVEDL